MEILIAILIIAFWLYNYIKFRRMYKYYTIMVDYLTSEVQISPSKDKMLRLSSALIHIQHYRDAFEVLARLSKDATNVNEGQKIGINLEFCGNPIPGLKRLKNLNHSYWHNFLLLRFGKRRYEFLTEQDYLTTSAIQRFLKS